MDTFSLQSVEACTVTAVSDSGVTLTIRPIIWRYSVDVQSSSVSIRLILSQSNYHLLLMMLSSTLTDQLQGALLSIPSFPLPSPVPDDDIFGIHIDIEGLSISARRRDESQGLVIDAAIVTLDPVRDDLLIRVLKSIRYVSSCQRFSVSCVSESLAPPQRR